MAGFGRDIADSFIDNGADRIANDFIPGNGVIQAGADQWLNNDINRDLGGGLGLNNGFNNGGGFGGGYGGGNGGGFF